MGQELWTQWVDIGYKSAGHVGGYREGGRDLSGPEMEVATVPTVHTVTGLKSEGQPWLQAKFTCILFSEAVAKPLKVAHELELGVCVSHYPIPISFLACCSVWTQQGQCSHGDGPSLGRLSWCPCSPGTFLCGQSLTHDCGCGSYVAVASM